MKRSNIILTVLVLAACLTVVMTQVTAQSPKPAAAPSGKTAVCDIVTVFNSYARATDLSGQFEQKRKEIKAQDAQKEAAIKHAEDILKGYTPGSKKYEDQLTKVENLAIERESWRRVKEASASRWHRLLTEEMYREILDVVAEVAKKGNYDLVLFKESVELASQSTTELLNKIAQRKCLYASDAIDITVNVLEQANKQYRSRTKR